MDHAIIVNQPGAMLSANFDRSFLIERGLRKSLNDGYGFVLEFQPQINLLTGNIFGAESLLRWSFDNEVISPLEFITVAEDSGLIVEIGELVLRMACSEARKWELLGLGGQDGIKVAVNVSVKQVSNGLPVLVQDVLIASGLSTHLLELEITESFFIEKELVAVFHSLRDSGIKVSIDDFGTGYSCLSVLKDLPLSTIKIDRAFVDGLENGGRSLPIVEMIIDLAHKLGMSTVAEGVECEKQVEILKALGCSMFQGFFFSKPLSADAFVEFVKRSL